MMIANRLIAFVLTFFIGLLASLFGGGPSKETQVVNTWSRGCHSRDFRRNWESQQMPSGCFVKIDTSSDKEATVVYCSHALTQEEKQAATNYILSVNGSSENIRFVMPTTISTSSVLKSSDSRKP